MKITDAVDILAALAQDSRLSILRALIRHYPRESAAGDIGRELGIAPATLSFHLGQLQQAGLLECRRDGRSRLYRARLETMNGLMAFLFEDCCHGRPDTCPESLLAGHRQCPPQDIEPQND